MKTIDFSRLAVRLKIEGGLQSVDVRRDLGNYVFAASADIAMSDWGREIYYSEGAVAVPLHLASGFAELVRDAPFVAPVKRAVLELLADEEGTVCK